jgi:lysophospholipase L1-like esterase
MPGVWYGHGIRKTSDITSLARALRGGVVIATRGFYRGSRGAAGASCMGCGIHYVPTRAWNLRLVYGNFYYNSATSSREDPNTNNITVKAAIEDSGGVIHPVHFNGARQVTVGMGAFVVSDPLHIEVPAGDWIRSRTYMTVSAGEYVPLWSKPFTTHGAGEKNLTTPADAVDTAYASWGASDSNITCGPIAIIGENDGMAGPSVMIVGDSIANGTQDYDLVNSNGDSVYGWPRRVLGKECAFVQTAYTGDRLEYTTPNAAHRMRAFLAAFCTHVLIALGVNDVSAGATLAQLQSRYTTLCGIFKLRGCQIIGCTITPKTTTTDAWRTTANQTPDPGDGVRVQFNNWLRTKPCGEAAIWDVADECESARDSGLWRVGTVGIASDTATGGSTSTVVKASAGWTTNQWRGQMVVMTSGLNAGVGRHITSNTSDTLTTTAFSNANASGDTFTVGQYPTQDGIHPMQWLHERIETNFRAAGLHTSLRVP